MWPCRTRGRPQNPRTKPRGYCRRCSRAALTRCRPAARTIGPCSVLRLSGGGRRGRSTPCRYVDGVRSTGLGGEAEHLPVLTPPAKHQATRRNAGRELTATKKGRSAKAGGWRYSLGQDTRARATDTAPEDYKVCPCPSFSGLSVSPSFSFSARRHLGLQPPPPSATTPTKVRAYEHVRLILRPKTIKSVLVPLRLVFWILLCFFQPNDASSSSRPPPKHTQLTTTRFVFAPPYLVFRFPPFSLLYPDNVLASSDS